MRKRTLAEDNRGMVAVEFALILPILLATIFGTIDFSMFLFNRQVLANAAREAARAGIMARANRLSNQDIEDIVTDRTQGHLVTFDGGRTPEITIWREEPNLADARFGHDLKVTVKYTYDCLFLFTPGAGKWSLPIEISSTMRME